MADKDGKQEEPIFTYHIKGEVEITKPPDWNPKKGDVVYWSLPTPRRPHVDYIPELRYSPIHMMNTEKEKIKKRQEKERKSQSATVSPTNYEQ